MKPSDPSVAGPALTLPDSDPGLEHPPEHAQRWPTPGSRSEPSVSVPDSDPETYAAQGGCYAKCIGLDAEKEPEIFGAIRFGAILENVVFDEYTREVDYMSK